MAVEANDEAPMTDGRPTPVRARPIFDSTDIPAAVASVRQAREALQRLGGKLLPHGRADELRTALAASQDELTELRRTEPIWQRWRGWVYGAAATVIRVAGLGPSDWWAAPFVLGLIGAGVATLPALMVGQSTVVRIALILAGYLVAVATTALTLAPQRSDGPAVALARLTEARTRRQRRIAELRPACERLAAEAALASKVEQAAAARTAAETRYRELETLTLP